MANYRVPDNYLYDTKSGLYYREMFLRDKQGKPVRHVIWFDCESGEYTQKSYYISSKSNKKVVVFITSVCLLLLAIFLFRRSVVGTKPVMNQEELIQSVGITDSNDKSLSFQQYEAILEDTGVVK